MLRKFETRGTIDAGADAGKTLGEGYSTAYWGRNWEREWHFYFLICILGCLGQGEGSDPPPPVVWTCLELVWMALTHSAPVLRKHTTEHWNIYSLSCNILLGVHSTWHRKSQYRSVCRRALAGLQNGQQGGLTLWNGIPGLFRGSHCAPYNIPSFRH